MLLLGASVLFFAFSATVNNAQTTEFTYQGKLTDGGQTASGNYDFEFGLFDAETSGTALAVQQRLNVSVTAGIFSVKLDFGANFNGQARFLEISVRPAGSANAFTLLAPRQPFTSTPYAIQSLKAANAAQLGGVDSNQYVLTTDPRMSDERNPAPNSANYIQNTLTPQTNSNFNISGNGNAGGKLSANTINSANSYNIGGSRVLGIAGSDNLFVGVGAGASNPIGNGNSFFGTNAGLNTTNRGNSFFGTSAGQSNTGGSHNSFFGFNAGKNNSVGINNSLFGVEAGFSNTTGSSNSIFGAFAGSRNTTGAENSFFGNASGSNTTNGSSNVFLGSFVGVQNTIGSRNTFVGFSAGSSNTTGSNNTIIGGFANVFADNLSFATAIGAQAIVLSSNTIQLGRIGGQDQVIAPGGIALRDSSLRLRAPTDSNHSIRYDRDADGIRFTAFQGFRWVSSINERTQMDLTVAGDLFIAGSYRQFSDARYKTNVQTLTGALDAVRRLRGVTFDWKFEQNKNRQPQIGFIAQEIEEVLPALVSTDANGNKSVSYSNAVPVLVEAVKEQQAQIEAQNTRNQEQEARITKQDALISEQQQQIKLQQALITQMKSIICRAHPAEKICEEK